MDRSTIMGNLKVKLNNICMGIIEALVNYIRLFTHNLGYCVRG